MASVVPLEQDNEPATPELRATLDLQTILSSQNLAELLDQPTLNKIGQNVIRDVEIDESSRGDWLERYERSLDVAMQVKKPKTFPWPRASNVKYPLLTVASIQFQARAYPAIVDGSNLVKGRVLGPDPDGKKRARAERIGQHMTWQLLYKMPAWEEDTDQLLLILPIVGCMFRKSYYDSIENANRSETVTAEDFVINYWAKSIETAPRYTQVLHYYPYEAQEFMFAGQWVKVPVEGDDTGEDDQALVDFYEQHRCIDLDDDGYPEHYVVTCTKEGEVARIVPCFGVEDITVEGQGETARLSKVIEAGKQNPQIWDMVGKIVRIERRQYFTKYGFIPAPDGSFYDIGFGTLLDDLTETIDTTLNQMIDAGALQNAGGGLIGSGVNVRGGNFRITIGELKRVDAPGGPLKDNIVMFEHKGPSAVLYQLLELLIQAAKDITSVQDIMTGDSPGQNTPATTVLAQIEQAQKVMTGIFKRIWRAFGQELRILRRLNRDYLDEEEYFQLNDSDAVQIGRQDYADEDLDVVPVADPTQASDMARITRAQAQFQMFNGDPLINQKLIREDMLQAMGSKDIPRYFNVPQPAPDPKLMLEVGDHILDKQKAGTEHIKVSATAADSLADAALKLAEVGLPDDAASLAAAAVHIGGEAEPHEVIHADNGQGGLSGVEGPAPDAGVSDPSQAMPDGQNGGMGPGSPDAAGGSGAGSPVGPVGEDQVPQQ